MDFKAAIFDMDGLLLDTERSCMQVFESVCQDWDLPFHRDVYLSIIGRNSKGIEAILSRAYGDIFPELREEWRRRNHLQYKHKAMPIKQGVLDLLGWLRAHGIPTAVATSARKPTAEIKLELAGLTPLFDQMATGCEVSQGKPDPEIYLLAAQRLGVNPSHCLAFEDSNNGARAAVAAGMRTYQIPDLVQPCDRTTALDHQIRDSLSQVWLELQQETASQLTTQASD